MRSGEVGSGKWECEKWKGKWEWDSKWEVGCVKWEVGCGMEKSVRRPLAREVFKVVRRIHSP